MQPAAQTEQGAPRSGRRVRPRLSLAPVPAAQWVLAGAAVLVLTAASSLVVSAAVGPAEFESEQALGSAPAWLGTVSYRPGEPQAQVALRMDGMRRYRDVSYRIESTEPWAPRWQGRLQGRLSEFVTLMGGADPPAPMTAALAQRATRSYRVTLVAEGEERAIDFSAGGPVTRAPFANRLEEWRHRLCTRLRFLQ